MAVGTELCLFLLRNSRKPSLSRIEEMYNLTIFEYSMLTLCLIGYYMSLAGGVLGVTALFAWIITFQLSWRNWEGAKSYMIYVPEEDRNEW